MPCNSTIRRSYRRVTSPCVRAALLPELTCCCSAPLCLNLNLNLKKKRKKKNGSPFYLSGVTVWWNFCLSVPFHAHVLLIFRGRSQQCFQPRTFTQTLTFFSHLLLPQPRHVSAPSAGGWPGSASGRASFPLVAVAADPLPARLLVSSRAAARKWKEEVYPACLPASVGKSPWCPHT